MQEETRSPTSNAELLRRMDQLAKEAADLKVLASAFERWHQDMIAMMAQHRELSGRGEDLDRIARQIVMVSLNAAIEAARAGDASRGFVVVAAEMRNLAREVQELSVGLAKNLHSGDLRTTATFQDLQAGGKLMMAAISGMESMVGQLRVQIG